MEVSLPALIGGMRDKTRTPGGSSDLLELLHTDAGQSIADVEGFLGSGDARSGAGILDRVFSERGEVALTSLGKASGLSTRLLAQVMSMLAPIAAGWLGDKARTEGFNEAELTAYLDGEAGSLEDAGYGKAAGAAIAAPPTPAAQPPAVPIESTTDYIDDAEDGDYGYVETDGAGDDETIPGAPRGVGDLNDPYQQPNRSGWFWWALAAITLIVLLALVLRTCGDDNPDETGVETTDSVLPTTGDNQEPIVDVQAELNKALVVFPNVSGSVVGDQAVLIGQVTDASIKEQAQAAALGVVGITGVDNQIQVGAGNSLKNLINADAELSTFAALMNEAGLTESLAGNGQFTVFAPANNAFAGLTAEELGALRADPAQLQQLLQYHVVSGIHPSNELAVTEILSTLQGEELAISYDGTTRINDQVEIVRPDVQADNGVYHIVSGVLRPSALAAAPEPAAAQELSATLALNPITFELGSSVITAEGKVEVDKVIDYLIQNEQSIEVGGHTDADGDEALNLTLSQDRADAVLEYLTTQGIPADSLTAVGFGEAQPIAPNDTNDNKAKNRRIEFRPN